MPVRVLIAESIQAPSMTFYKIINFYESIRDYALMHSK